MKNISYHISICLIALGSLFFSSELLAQTYPSPHDLSSSSYTFSGFADSTSNAYPTSMSAYSFTAGFPDGITRDGNLTNAALRGENQAGATSNRVRNEGVEGISIGDDYDPGTTEDLGVILVSLNTTNVTNVSLSWTCINIVSRPGVIKGMRLQYRVGTTGDFVDVVNAGDTVEYLTSNTSIEAAPETFSNIELPGDASDQPIVHVRWLYYQPGGAVTDAFHDRVSVDDITISGSVVNATFPTPHTLSLGDYTFTGFGLGTDVSYPTSMEGYSFPAGFLTSATLSVGTMENELLRPNSVGVFSDRIRNEVGNGISIHDDHDGVSNFGAILISLNTSNTSGIFISFTGRQIANRTAVQHSMRLQYRVGTSGFFTDVNDGGVIEYTSGLNSSAAPQTFSNISLPVDIEDETVVHLRWVYYQNGTVTNGLHDRIAIDDITITANSTDGIELDPAFCGVTLDSGDQFMTCETVPGAAQYEFEVNDNGGPLGTFTRIVNGPVFNLAYLWGQNKETILYNTAYDIRVRPLDGLGDTLFDYGSVCVVTTPNTPTTELIPSDCGSSIDSLNTVLVIDQVPFADNYEYEVTAPGFSQNYLRNSRAYNLQLSAVSGTVVDETYDIRVRPIVNGVAGTYGNTCQVTVNPLVKTVALLPSFCGISLTDLYDNLYCSRVPGGTQYEFQVRDSNNVIIESVIRPNNRFKFSDMAAFTTRSIEANHKYQVRVRATSNGVTGAYPLTWCEVTTPEAVIPNTSLRPYQCGTQLATFDDTLEAYDAPFNVEGFEFKITTASDVDIETLFSTDKYFTWNELSEVYTENTPYKVLVRLIEVSGPKEGVFSTACLITTPLTIPGAKKGNFVTDSNFDFAESEVNIYPNPFKSDLQIISVSKTNQNEVSIFDINGREIYQGSFETNQIQLNTSEYTDGMYIIRINDGIDVHSMRLLKKSN